MGPCFMDAERPSEEAKRPAAESLQSAAAATAKAAKKAAAKSGGGQLLQDYAAASPYFAEMHALFHWPPRRFADVPKTTATATTQVPVHVQNAVAAAHTDAIAVLLAHVTMADSSSGGNRAQPGTALAAQAALLWQRLMAERVPTLQAQLCSQDFGLCRATLRLLEAGARLGAAGGGDGLAGGDHLRQRH